MTLSGLGPVFDGLWRRHRWCVARDDIQEDKRVPMELEPVVYNPRQATFVLEGVKYELFRVKDGFSLVCRESKHTRYGKIFIPSDIPPPIPFWGIRG